MTDTTPSSCQIVPTDGVATLADYWCTSHDAPATDVHCEHGAGSDGQPCSPAYLCPSCIQHLLDSAL